MKNKFTEYAKIICSGESIISVLKNMKTILAKEGLYHEEGGCAEKMWHITHDPKLYEEVGDIFLLKVRNRDVANAAYNKYLYYTNPDFYNKYAVNLNSLGFNCIDTNNSDDDESQTITDLCDRFDLIVYMMICLHKNNDFGGVLELVEYLSYMKNKIFEYKDNHSNESHSYLNEIVATEKHLSEVLSETQNHNDINKFAVCLFNKNKKAYFNIVKDLITYKKYEEALNYYNDVVCPNIDYRKTDDIKSLCWTISDFYRDIFDFYNAVFMQKIALEIEVQEGNINA